MELTSHGEGERERKRNMDPGQNKTGHLHHDHHKKTLSSRTDVCNPKKHRFSLENPLPVRIDWSTRRVVDFMEVILMSAGTLSPTAGWEKKKRV